MPLLPPHLRPYLSDAAAIPSRVDVPNPLAGLGYDSATRGYVEQMGRLGSARQQYWSPVRRAQSTTRVLERFLNGPGIGLTPRQQIARAGQAKAFGRSLRGALGRTAGLGALLGVWQMGANAYQNSQPTTGVEENYLDSGSGAGANPVQPAAAASSPSAAADPKQRAIRDENQLMQQIMPSMFRDNFAEPSSKPIGAASGGILDEIARSAQTRPIDGVATRAPAAGYQGPGRAFQTGTMDMNIEYPAGYQGRGNAFQTGTMDMGIEYPAGYQGRGNAFQTDTRDMNIQYPTGYQGFGRAFQTGTEDMTGGWLGSIANAFQHTGVRR
jgi:hypothetical protein